MRRHDSNFHDQQKAVDIECHKAQTSRRNLSSLLQWKQCHEAKADRVCVACGKPATLATEARLTEGDTATEHQKKATPTFTERSLT